MHVSFRLVGGCIPHPPENRLWLWTHNIRHGQLTNTLNLSFLSWLAIMLQIICGSGFLMLKRHCTCLYVSPVNLDISVPIRSRMLVPESNRVHHFMHHNALGMATLTNWNLELKYSCDFLIPLLSKRRMANKLECLSPSTLWPGRKSNQEPAIFRFLTPCSTNRKWIEGRLDKSISWVVVRLLVSEKYLRAPIFQKR